MPVSYIPGELKNGFIAFLGSLIKHCLKVEDGRKVFFISEMWTLWCVNYMWIKLLKIIKDPQRTLLAQWYFGGVILDIPLYRKIRERNTEPLRTSPTKGRFCFESHYPIWSSSSGIWLFLCLTVLSLGSFSWTPGHLNKSALSVALLVAGPFYLGLKLHFQVWLLVRPKMYFNNCNFRGKPSVIGEMNGKQKHIKFLGLG